MPVISVICAKVEYHLRKRHHRQIAQNIEQRRYLELPRAQSMDESTGVIDKMIVVRLVRYRVTKQARTTIKKRVNLPAQWLQQASVTLDHPFLV